MGTQHVSFERWNLSCRAFVSERISYKSWLRAQEREVEPDDPGVPAAPRQKIHKAFRPSNMEQPLPSGQTHHEPFGTIAQLSSSVTLDVLHDFAVGTDSPLKSPVIELAMSAAGTSAGLSLQIALATAESHNVMTWSSGSIFTSCGPDKGCSWRGTDDLRTKSCGNGRRR